MNLFEIVLIALGLAMDCFAVSISCGMLIKDIRTGQDCSSARSRA